MSDSVPQDEVINLASSDDRKFTVSLKVIRQSGTITRRIANLTEEEDTIKIDNVHGDILEKVLIFIEHHVNSPPYLDNDDVCGWDVQFLNVDLGTLYGLTMAAVHLNIERLLHMTCRDIAYRMSGKTPEEIRRMFNIENDLTPEEEEQILRENPDFEWE